MGSVVTVGICLDFKIFCKNLEGVEMLTLIFMQTLDLNIENRVGVKADACFALYDFGKILFVFELDSAKVFEYARIV